MEHILRTIGTGPCSGTRFTYRFLTTLFLILSQYGCSLDRMALPDPEEKSDRMPASRATPIDTELSPFIVTTSRDSGEGSLRQAIINANNLDGADIITFDKEVGPFGTPQTITLESPLPELESEVTIDARSTAVLWKASGVTISGGGKFPVFVISDQGRVTLSALTVADGYARSGGGVLNRGELVLKDCTLLDNVAEEQGGGLINIGGKVNIINSTFYANTAQEAGGGLCSLDRSAIVTNSTFSENSAPEGGALYSNGQLLLRNTILANSGTGKDCVNTGELDTASTNNLIESNVGCGTPISTLDPRLGKLAYYNGPMQTLPISSGSPAINLGDNASAIDEHGGPLRWDQRGNGDPRFVGGITDIGAFEHQSFPRLVVDTVEDSELRGCTRTGTEDCSLRGAINLANAGNKPAKIQFDPRVFAQPRVIELQSSLPLVSVDMEFDSTDTAGVTLTGTHRYRVFRAVPGINLNFSGIQVVDEAKGE